MSKIAENPYPGSRAFKASDQALFCGREADTAAITNLWKTNRLTIVSGPVASGKTSLLHAGVYPSMPTRRSRVLPVGTLTHEMTFPFPAMTDHNPLTLALLTSWSPDEIPGRLTGLSISEFVRPFFRGADEATYAAIDQVEDLAPAWRPDAHALWRQQFLDELSQALADHPRLHLLLVTRSEGLSGLTRSVGAGAQHEITTLTTQAALESLTRPAEAAGRFYTRDAASALIGDLSVDEYIEPSLLQAVCRQLWEEVPSSVTGISEEVIREFSDTDTALSIRCGQVIGEVAALYGISSRQLHAWLVTNFITDADTRDRVREGRTTAGQPNAIPRSLLDRHLFTSEIDESQRYYRLLASRLAVPLRKAIVHRHSALTAAHYLRAAGRDLAMGELDYAWAHAEHTLRAGPTIRERARAEALLGNVQHTRGKPGEALPHYRQAAELLQASGQTAAAAQHLAAAGQLLLAEGEPTDAILELRAAVERAPNDLALQTRLALALWQLGDGRGAVAILNWVLTVNGGHAEALRARGEILTDLGEPRDAMVDLNRMSPGRPSTRAALGLALAELGDYTAATKEINGAVLFYAARAFDLAGDKVSARERAIEAIDATDPPLSPAHKRLALKLAGRRFRTH